MMKKRWGCFVAAFFASALLAACGGAPIPPANPSTTAPTPASETSPPLGSPSLGSPSPATTPSVTVRPDINIPEPEKYPEMANDDLDGADAAARYFLNLYGHVYETGDLTTWQKMSDSECEVCSKVSQEVESSYAQGHWFENYSLLHGESIVYYPTEDVPYYIIFLEVSGSDYDYFDATGELILKGPRLNFPEYAVGVQFVAPTEWKLMGLYSGEGH